MRRESALCRDAGARAEMAVVAWFWSNSELNTPSFPCKNPLGGPSYLVLLRITSPVDRWWIVARDLGEPTRNGAQFSALAQDVWPPASLAMPRDGSIVTRSRLGPIASCAANGPLTHSVPPRRSEPAAASTPEDQERHPTDAAIRKMALRAANPNVASVAQSPVTASSLRRLVAY